MLLVCAFLAFPLQGTGSAVILTGIVECTLSVVVNDLHAFNCHITL